ncbi:MAG: hypothetical protein CVV64_13745 [Candidatus Wallbacteria bacterium HGW-Wallbacteria-1]|uniref:EamA domain-containing protein n=1 Tax=Candidatus Wallbacteria bacterium HGW-Wallbacteria-1 TaxID=2013854 RepID=A0A2N1PMA4_9BACT|nr:MAG: hypothetical protein CVV64_13745 [Candidatus Wallbacteria bacterium HGW-Wallbacteria-1]
MSDIPSTFKDLSPIMWIVPTLISTVLYGFYNFGARVSSARGYNSSATIFISTLTVFIGATLTLIYRIHQNITPIATTPWGAIMLLAAGNGFFFATGSSLKFKALEKIPGNIAFPVLKFNTLFVVLLSLPVFGEMPEPLQWAGILLAVAAIILLSGANRQSVPGFPTKNRTESQSPCHNPSQSFLKSMPEGFSAGIALAILSALTTALSALINKTAALKSDRIAFIAFSYAVSAAVSGFMAIRKKGLRSTPTGQIMLGTGMGILNYIGFILILKAFSMGPLSVIHPIFSMSMVISVTLSTFVFREPFNRRTALALIAAVIAVILVT